MGLSSFASKPIEDVIAANPKTFFQMYWVGSREPIAAQILERARQAGATAIILTLDWSFAHRRDWGSPAIPEPSSTSSRWPSSRRRCCGSRAGCATSAEPADPPTSACRT